jgi:molecular chaperone GrpE (heat shock protein)
MLYSTETVSAKAVPANNNDDWRQRYVQSMRTRLNMGEDQLKELNDTLDETRIEYRLLRQRYKPEMEKIHQVQVEKIKKFLKPEQVSEFEKMEREREEKMRARESGPGI